MYRKVFTVFFFNRIFQFLLIPFYFFENFQKIMIAENTIFQCFLLFVANSSQKNHPAEKNHHADRNILAYGKLVESFSSTVENFSNVRHWTKKSFCPYCFQDVTHFPRHLKRNHKHEGAVKEILSLPLKDPKRKQLLNTIRRQGNFVANSHNNIHTTSQKRKITEEFL